MEKHSEQIKKKKIMANKKKRPQPIYKRRQIN